MAGALKRGLLALAMVLSLVLPLGLSACGKGAATTPRTAPDPSRNARSLQEVAPPAAVLQIKAALDRFRPRVTILAPADDSLLPPGPWDLTIKVSDWPLVDAGSLGLGPHLVVQIDDQEPIRSTSAAPVQGDDQSRTVRLHLDPLSPGSHRITAYAARPWGEAVKDPGASAQISVHRVVATPLSQPRRGEPQLLAVSPPALSGREPVLIDWLLRDAPLQHLRDDDTHWRLRITVNGDSFQVDRQMPLWLKGFRPGSNAVVLELLDGLGEPIAPNLNTLVREVFLRPGEQAVWNGKALAPDVLAALLGEAPAQAGSAGSASPLPADKTKAVEMATDAMTAAETKALESKGFESQSVETKAHESKGFESQSVEGKTAGTKAVESQAAESKSFETKAIETRADETPAQAQAAGGIASQGSPAEAPTPMNAGRQGAAATASPRMAPEPPEPSLDRPAAAAPSAEGRNPAADASTRGSAEEQAADAGGLPEPAAVADPLPVQESTPSPSVSSAASAGRDNPAREPAESMDAPAAAPVRTAPALPPARSELTEDGRVIKEAKKGLLSGWRRGDA